MRISRSMMFMSIALIMAKRSTCLRANVGAVLVGENRILSTGYNGPDSESPHCSGTNCPGYESGCVSSIHAERNAFERNLILNPLLIDSIYLTLSPCLSCAKMMENLTIKPINLFFYEQYRDVSGLTYLEKNYRFKLYRIMSNSTILSWPNNEIVTNEI